MSSHEVVELSEDHTLGTNPAATSVAEEANNNNADSCKQGEGAKERICYTQEELLNLRTAPASLKRPAALAEEFYLQNDVWDPGQWHKVLNSGSSTPPNEHKGGTEFKKGDLFGDSINLTPQRKSFQDGCHVQNKSDTSLPDSRLPFSKQQKLDSYQQPLLEGKSRLTGRAAGQRKSLEKAYYKERDLDQDRNIIKLVRDHESGKIIRKDRDLKRPEHYRGPSIRHADSESSLPEWAVDGPTSQSDTIELKGFDDDAERRDSLKKRGSFSRGNTTDSDQTDKTREGFRQGRSSSSTLSGASSKNSNTGGLNDSNKENEKPPSNVEAEKAPSRRTTPVDNFDLNELFDMLELVPSEMFADEDSSGKSRFSKWFHQGRCDSRSGSLPLFPDPSATIARGLSPEESSLLSNSYFTPIQPAPPCSAPSPEVPSLLDILQRARSNSKSQPVKEIRGRMKVNDIEPPMHGTSLTNSGTEEKDGNPQEEVSCQSAFEKLVQTMKKSGQLPEKPAPVVTGLPDHLLPKPPRKTSPTFEKLKRQLSRSPSPLAFLNKTLMSQQAGLLTPDFFKQSHIPKTLPPSEFFKQAQNGERVPQSAPHDFAPVNAHARPFIASDERTTQSQPVAKVTKVPTAFLPTSVMKKMHTDKVEKEPVAKEDFPRAVGHLFDSTRFQDDALKEQLHRASQLPFSSPSSSRDSVASMFSSPCSTKSASIDAPTNTPWENPSHRFACNTVLPGRPPLSAPNTPANRNINLLNPTVPQSAPVTPRRNASTDPPTVQRLVNNSAFMPLGGNALQSFLDTSRQERNGIDKMDSLTPNQDSDVSQADSEKDYISSNTGTYLFRSLGTSGHKILPDSFSSSSSAMLSSAEAKKSDKGGDSSSTSIRQIKSLFHGDALSNHSELAHTADVVTDKIQQRNIIENVFSTTESEEKIKGMVFGAQGDTKVKGPNGRFQQAQTAFSVPHSSSTPSVPSSACNSTYETSRVPQALHPPMLDDLREAKEGLLKPDVDTQLTNKAESAHNSSLSAKKGLGGMASFPGHKPSNGPRKRISPPIPTPLQPNAIPGTIPSNLIMNRNTGIANAGAAIAAQALVHQHMLAHAARAQVLQAAQLYQQQQQQQALQAQVQAAIMAQAFARNRAVMYNPRPMMYPPLGAVAGQSRAPNIQPLVQQPAPPTSFLPRNPCPQGLPHHNIKDDSKSGLPVTSDSSQINPLAKWFGNDILKKTKHNPVVDPTAKAKMICVEEIEQMH